jgi:hypothetical protein
VREGKVERAGQDHRRRQRQHPGHADVADGRPLQSACAEITAAATIAAAARAAATFRSDFSRVEIRAAPELYFEKS